MSELRLIPRITPEEWIAQAKERWEPIATACLFSGGNDSSVVAARCKAHYDHLLFLDTGLAVPGTTEHIRQFAEWIGKPLVIRRSGDAYRELVLGDHTWDGDENARGFPGKGKHWKAYSRLKERRIEDHLRALKVGGSRTDSVLFLSGIRRAESVARSNLKPLSERGSAKFCDPLIEWGNEEVREYRDKHELPVSDGIALLHRSTDCQCGAFANAEGERAMLKSLWPEWFENVIEKLEREAEERGVRWCRWGGYDLEGNQAAGTVEDEEREAEARLCSNCPTRLFDPAEAAA